MDEYYNFPLPIEFGVEEVPFPGNGDDLTDGGTVRGWENYLHFLKQFRCSRGEKQRFWRIFFLSVVVWVLYVTVQKAWKQRSKGDK